MVHYKPKNTLFRKLLLTYGIAIIAGFTILAILLMNFFNRYFIDNKKELLLSQAEKISREMAGAYFLKNIDIENLSDMINVLDEFLNAGIWFVDGNGKIWLYSANSYNKDAGSTIDKAKLRTLYRGYYFFEKGTFDGMIKDYSLSIGYPIFNGNAFEGGVIIHAPLNELKTTLMDIYKITIGTILLAMLIAALGLYWNIRRISLPIKEISNAARKIASGEFQKRLNIKTDDEIEELGHSFNHMAESLEKIEENRANLVANISHDLRTPMTSIIGFIEGILDGTIPEESHKRYLDIILEESKRLVKITNDILELSNMQQGIISVSKSSFDVNEIIRRRLLAFENKITEKAIEVALILENEKNIVYSDQMLIDRILQNLIDNAIKFTPNGKELCIKCYNNQDKTQIEVMNTGVSIDENELRKIWDRFHKGDASRGKHKTGFGLGLAIVKEIILHLDEEIWVESKDNNVKFIFTISKNK